MNDKMNDKERDAFIDEEIAWAKAHPKEAKAQADKATKELRRMYARDRADKRATKKVVDRVMESFTPRMSYHRKVEVAKELGARLGGFYGAQVTEHPLFVPMLDGFIQDVVGPAIVKNLNRLWATQKDKEDSYGDADYYFTKYLDNEKVRVSLIRDVVTCSDMDRFIIIEDKKTQKVHIRLLVEDGKSDYPQGRFPLKLSLKFFKDRDFVMEFRDDLHGTNKGGVYGDIRDVAYVLSFSLKKDRMFSDRVEKSIYFFKELDHVTWVLDSMASQE